ncbi:hypothetical protein E2F48_14030 [Arthrobacter crusticola]|uniref:SnoaL-like domain-containing protein n=1 Tax=Arthrobacter crusticola TaxID=2547960 RepID=A0A4R5TNF4_9MICC|nr:nuclear transport factor 2 family protein [Arthrobacter crusticola]TDK23913.1 hypothetical protein E2F48_14030 [Arthrobacter crusticola]
MDRSRGTVRSGRPYRDCRRPGGADDAQRFSNSKEFVSGLKDLMGPLRTVHQVHAPEITVLTEDSASGIWAVADRLSFPPGAPLSVLQGYGHYQEKYARVGGRWVITDLRLTRLLLEPTPQDRPGDPTRQ